MAKKKTVKRRKKVAPKSVGLAPTDVAAIQDPELERLTQQVQSDGGTVLAAYREPIGGTTVLLAALPIDRVEPTPFQRDPSEPHVKRLMNVIETLGRFLDPIIAIREHDGYWTPNGNHRLQALRKIGAQTVIALLLPDPEVAFKLAAQYWFNISRPEKNEFVGFTETGLARIGRHSIGFNSPSVSEAWRARGCECRSGPIASSSPRPG